jgi:aerotaxis receptor
MKTNLPVTQREVFFPKGHYLVSRTDLQGRILDANDAFVKISGFSREELIGQHHHIVRHPDMPREAFEDLWKTVKAGCPWRGMVKNRCKNGDHYWVNAFVVPVTEKGQVTGYMSVRSEPSRDHIKEAEALYGRLRDKKAKLPFSCKAGGLSLRMRLGLVAVVATLSLIAVLMVAFKSLSESNDALRRVYETKLVPANMASQIVYWLGDNRSQIALSLQHEPSNPFYSMHDHDISMHVNATLENRRRINEMLERLEKIPLTEHQKGLMARFSEIRHRFSREGVNAARDALSQGDFRLANQLLLTKINPIYTEMNQASSALLKDFEESAKTAYHEAEARYKATLIWTIGIGAISMLLVIGMTIFVATSITRRFNQMRQSLQKIAEGDLREQFSTGGLDELGRLGNELAVTQTRIKVMLDRVSRSSDAIDQQVDALRREMQQVYEQSMQQQNQVESVAAATEEFSQSVQEVSAGAQNTAQSANESRTLVKKTNQAIENSMVATSGVVSVVQETGKAIDELNGSIASIGDITKTINEIAEQTNLLALNAAIEAARAGELGRGFAVVADEVRKLAERTATSTADITRRVSAIQSVTVKAVGSMNRAVSEVETGVGMMRQSAEGLGEVVQASDAVATESSHIADAAQQQAIASNEVARSMEEVATSVERNVQAAQHAAQACDLLANNANSLRGLVKEFKLTQ